MKVEYISPKNWFDRTQWRLLEDYTSSTGIIVPEDFISDGASVPWFLRWRFSPTGAMFPAAVVHDYLLITNTGWTRSNVIFNMELQKCNVPAYERWLIMTAVKVYARIKKFI